MQDVFPSRCRASGAATVTCIELVETDYDRQLPWVNLA